MKINKVDIQSQLVSGTNIKTINSTSLLGSGDLVLGGLPSWVETNATDLTIWNNGKSNIVSNTSFGDTALSQNSTGTFNTAYGVSALRFMTSGGSNTAVGNNALSGNTTSSNNTAVGRSSLGTLTTGTGNTAIGSNSGNGMSTGSNNVLVGNSVVTGLPSAGETVIIGGQASGSTGSTILGSQATSGLFTHSIVLGRSATATADNQFVVGSSTYISGAVATEVLTPSKTWSVIINGVAQKILLA